MRKEALTSIPDQQTDSVGFLRLKFAQARENNPRYSLRAFAKKLGLSPGGLSQLFAGKKRLSLERAHEITHRLGLSAPEKERFLLTVQFETSRTVSARAQTYERLMELTGGGESGLFDLSLEHFQLISEWYGLAILEMLSTFAAKWSVAKVAEYLGVSKVEVEVMIERLVRLELIEALPGGGYRRLESRLLVSSKTPSEALRKYYRQLLDKAKDSIESQDPSEKVIGTEVFAFDAGQIDEARKLTDQYLDSLLAFAKKGKQRTEMYQVITDFFRLNQKPQRKTKASK